MSAYQKMKESMASGWNTWDTRSVLSHVLLPEGFAVSLGIKEYKAGRYLKEALIGRYQPKIDPALEYRGGEYAEEVTPVAHASDGSYTELVIKWRGIKLQVRSATMDGDLVIRIDPLENQKYPATLAVECGILWNRAGCVKKDGEVIVAALPERQIRVYFTKPWIEDAYIAVQTPYAAMRLDGPVGVSTGKSRSIEEITATIETKKREWEEESARFGEQAELYNAIQGCLAWATIFEPKKGRVVTTGSRTWNVDRNFGGYLICCWDTYFAAYMASLVSKELAYSNAIEMTREKVAEGFIPICATGTGYSAHDRSQPPVGSLVIKELYRRFRDIWLLEETFDALYEWNQWFFKKRQICEGLLAWGSNPSEPVYDNFFEMERINDMYSAKLESGMDNASTYDDVTYNKEKNMMEYADVGLTSLYIMDCDALAEIADILGKGEEAAQLKERADISQNALRSLWDDDAGMFLNRHIDTGKPGRRLSPANFYPLLTDAVSKEQAERMVGEHFYNPDEFWGEWILPCSARNDPGYQDQYYWRGRIWGPTNFLVYLGLRKYGLHKAQKDLSEKSEKLILKEWLECRHVHENYHADLGVGCDDATESEKLLTFGGLLALIPLIECGYLEGPELPLE